MPFAYEPAHYPMRPAGSCRPGARALLDVTLFFVPGTTSSGCYNPRTVAGSRTVSTHAEGRAIDVRPHPFSYRTMLPGAGPRLMAWCVALADHADALGVQQIIYAGRTWRVGVGWRHKPTGNRHFDHAHIELTRAAAEKLTAAKITAAMIPDTGDDTMTPEQHAQLTAAIGEVRQSVVAMVAAAAGTDRGAILTGGADPARALTPYATRGDVAQLSRRVAAIEAKLDAAISANGTGPIPQAFADTLLDELRQRLTD